MKYKDEYGNWVSIALPSLDSMPVGTQIEYTGTDIPVGWEEVNDYSTTEIDTGKKWIDGKPIYRKVFNIGSFSNSSTVSVFINDNIDNVIDFEGYVKRSGDSSVSNRLYSIKWSYFETYYLNSYMYFRTTESYISSSGGYGYIEYTKTTD